MARLDDVQIRDAALHPFGRAGSELYKNRHAKKRCWIFLQGDSMALDRAIAGEELSYKDGIELMNYDNLISWEPWGRGSQKTRGRHGDICGIILHELHKRLRG